MKWPYRITLFISIMLTIAVFIHEYLYDKPTVPYSIADYIVDIILGGLLYTGIFWGMITGIYLLACKTAGLVKKAF